MSRKIFILTSVLTSLFILGLLSGVFAALVSDDDYQVHPFGSQGDEENIQVKYWSHVALNSVTNAFGGELGHYSATTWHWGRLHNVNYRPHVPHEITIRVIGGSIWDNDGEDNDIHTAKAVGDEGAWREVDGPSLDRGDPPAAVSFSLTNSHNYGAIGTHTIRGFTNTVTRGGRPGAQSKATFRLEVE